MWSVPLHVPCPCHGAWPRSGRGLYAPWEVACSPPVYAPLAAGTLLGRGSDSAGGAHAVYRVMGTYVCTNVQFFHANLEIITKLEAWILKLLETAGLLHACTVVGKIVTKSKATCMYNANMHVVGGCTTSTIETYTSQKLVSIDN